MLHQSASPILEPAASGPSWFPAEAVPEVHLRPGMPQLFPSGQLPASQAGLGKYHRSLIFGSHLRLFPGHGLPVRIVAIPGPMPCPCFLALSPERWKKLGGPGSHVAPQGPLGHSVNPSSEAEVSQSLGPGVGSGHTASQQGCEEVPVPRQYYGK